MKLTVRRVVAAAFVAGTFPAALLAGALRIELRAAASQRAVFLGATVVAIITIGALAFWRRRGFWSVPSVFVTVCTVFHFGLVGALGAGLLDESLLSAYAWHWVTGEAASEAAILSAVGVWSSGAGALAAQLMRGPAPEGRREEPDERLQRRFASALSLVGAGAVFVAIAAWIASVVSAAGLKTLVGSYGDYLAAVSRLGALLGFVWATLGLGTVALAIGAPRPARTVGRVALATFAVVAFPLGLRGELLFPLVAAAAAKALGGWRPRRSVTLATVVGLLGAIALVRGVRETGLIGERTGPLSISVLDGLAELGGSLHPVERVVLWRDQGEQALWGASYIAPIDRAISHVLPWREQIPASSDQRMLDLVTQQRVGPIGFSVIAEAFHNWRLTGVLMVMFLLGVLLDWLDRRGGTIRGQLLAGVILLPLLMHVRNGFIFVPAQIAIGLAFVGLVQLVTQARSVVGIGSVARRAE